MAGQARPRVALGFDVGRSYPCWFDPGRPERVVLRRGPSGVALLALVPVVALAALVPAVRRAWRG
jgi:hypothetical protein